MELDSLKAELPKAIIESLAARGISKLTPPQASAIEKGLLKGSNIVVSSPTASGKTIVAEIACAMAILSKGKKAVYIAPMRALASEKFTEFKADYPYIKSVLSIGDLDAERQVAGRIPDDVLLDREVRQPDQARGRLAAGTSAASSSTRST